MAVTMLSSESDLISAQMFQDCLHQAVSSNRDRDRNSNREGDSSRDRDERGLRCMFHSLRYATRCEIAQTLPPLRGEILKVLYHICQYCLSLFVMFPLHYLPSQERPGLAARLNGLSEVELNLAAAIARVRMRISGYTGSSSSSTSSSSAGGVTMRAEKGKGGAGNSKNLRNITVDDAMSEFHRLSSVVARKVRH